MTAGTPRIAVVSSHPIQYYSPIYRELSRISRLHVLFAHRATPQDQSSAGYGHAFDWDVDLLSGFRHSFLKNRSARPSTSSFFGCDVPDVGKALASEGGFDAVVLTGWNLLVYWQAVAACRARRLPVVVRGDSQLATRRSPAKSLLKALLFGQVLGRFDAFLSVGVRSREYLVRYGVPPERIFDSLHCVDNDRFARDSRMTPERRRDVRAAWGIPEKGPVALFVGRVVPSKRPLDVVRAVARLREEGVDGSLVVAGAGPLLEDLQKECSDRGVPCRCLGFVNQSDLPQVYAASDVLVLPSDASETWGLVVNEAMACGRVAVVSDRVGCAPDLVVPGRTGAVYPCGDVPRLAEALRSALRASGDPASAEGLRTKMSEYSPAAAARGILEAVRYAVRRRAA